MALPSLWPRGIIQVGRQRCGRARTPGGCRGWTPIYNLNLSDDVIGRTGAPAIALGYPWTHLISGHLGRVATREDVAMHQQYIADIEASSREALASVNPIRIAVGLQPWPAPPVGGLGVKARG